jgi:D-arabinose 1-dehydrogenase-like Zn-dependent alcohol dehydrogenase
MKAMQLNHAGQVPVLIATELPQPKPGEGELLIRVRAVGVTHAELSWYPTTHAKDGTPRKRAVLGHEFSGVIAALGKNTKGFEVGQDIYGMSDWFVDGAIAEFCVTQPQSIAPKPTTLTHQAAAAVPIGALTAWQGLFERAKMQPGERVLVQGGSGAFGLFAVQLAYQHGAHVIATLSKQLAIGCGTWRSRSHRLQGIALRRSQRQGRCRLRHRGRRYARQILERAEHRRPASHYRLGTSRQCRAAREGCLVHCGAKPKTTV